jgi:hypothetical protein
MIYPKRYVFRAFHKTPLLLCRCMSYSYFHFLSFPQIHSAHHNNKLYHF